MIFTVELHLKGPCSNSLPTSLTFGTIWSFYSTFDAIWPFCSRFLLFNLFFQFFLGCLFLCILIFMHSYFFFLVSRLSVLSISRWCSMLQQPTNPFSIHLSKHHKFRPIFQIFSTIKSTPRKTFSRFLLIFLSLCRSWLGFIRSSIGLIKNMFKKMRYMFSKLKTCIRKRLAFPTQSKTPNFLPQNFSSPSPNLKN